MDKRLSKQIKALAENTGAGVHRTALNLSSIILDRYEVFLSELNEITKEDMDEIDRDIKLCENIKQFSSEMSERFKS